MSRAAPGVRRLPQEVIEAHRHPGRLRLHRSRKGERLSMSKADYADQAVRPDSSEDSLPLTAESHSQARTRERACGRMRLGHIIGYISRETAAAKCRHRASQTPSTIQGADYL